MPLSARQSVLKVREYIGRPGPSSPNNSTIVMKMNDEANTIWAELNITRDEESFKRFEQPIDPQVAEYRITKSDWGRPFMVETWDGGADPLYVPQEVTIAGIQNRDIYQTGVSPNTQGAGQIVVSFFTLNGQPTMAIQPVQTQSTMLRIYYEVEAYVLAFNDLALPIRDQFNHRLCIKTALACLPDTGHDDTTYGRILSQLLRRDSQLEELFQHQRFQMTNDNNARSSFGWEREGDWF